MIWYAPDPSVTVDRVFSIKTGLAASTVTPGRTAPEVSFTMPLIVACAKAATGNTASSRSAAAPLISTRFIRTSWSKGLPRCADEAHVAPRLSADQWLSDTSDNFEMVIYRGYILRNRLNSGGIDRRTLSSGAG